MIFMMLAADEGDAFSEVEEEILDPPEEGALHVAFVSGSPQRQEIELIGILEHLLGEIGGCRREDAAEIRHRLALAGV
jgi:hypothetical protein